MEREEKEERREIERVKRRYIERKGARRERWTERGRRGRDREKR